MFALNSKAIIGENNVLTEGTYLENVVLAITILLNVAELLTQKLVMM